LKYDYIPTQALLQQGRHADMGLLSWHPSVSAFLGGSYARKNVKKKFISFAMFIQPFVSTNNLKAAEQIFIKFDIRQF
jgi:hypothetical protein